MEKLNSKQIKRIELDILIALADFCDRHGLKYYLAYGTLIGAIRHKGFIPWDDDIDVVMLREDYMKLCTLLDKEQIRSDLEWRSVQNGKWNEPFGKLENTNTTACTRGNIEIGLWVDVFPVDYFDPHVVRTNQFWRKVHIGKAATHFKFTKKGVAKYIFKCLFFWKPYMQIAQEMNRRAQSVPKRELVASCAWGANDHGGMDIVEFEDPCYVEFEGHKFKTFKDWHLYLTRIYGDYMQLPPEKDRKTHEIDAYWVGNDACPF